MTTTRIWTPLAQSPPTFVIDASIPRDWWFGPSALGYANDIVSRMVSTAVAVPGVWSVQVAELLLARERAGLTTAARSQQYLVSISRFEVQVDRETPFRAWGDALDLARAHGLTVADAAYLELALRLNLSLASADAALARAATAAGVPIFTP